jgi:hypothetical protein
MPKLKIKSDDDMITVRVPIAIRKRGGRKLVIAPDGSPVKAVQSEDRVHDALVKAIARAYRWQELLENGTYATIAEIAESEKINETYVGRILRLTLLAPHKIENIVSGRNSHKLDLASLMRPVPILWKDQAGSSLVR